MIYCYSHANKAYLKETEEERRNERDEYTLIGIALWRRGLASHPTLLKVLVVFYLYTNTHTHTGWM